jgi:hypothetical protein
MRADGMPRSDSRAISASLHEIVAENVVPRAHHVAAVDRYRHRRCVRENVARRGRAQRFEFTHDRDEVIAVSAEAVQPDHAGRRRRMRLQFDGRQ